MIQTPRRFLRVEQNIRSYLVRRLLPLVKAELASCEATVPLAGMNSLVRIVRTDDGKGFVVRVYPRSTRKKVRLLVDAYELLRSKGVSVPEIVDWIEDFSKSHLAIYSERLIEGQTLAQCRFAPASSAQLAELLIPLHRAKSPRWGEPKRLKEGDFSAYSMKRVMNRLRRVRKGLTRATDPAVFRKISDWFANQRHRFAEVRQFDLTHDKINPGNLLWADQQKRYYLLDLVTLRYGARTKDLVALYHEILRHDREAIDQFERVYFAAFPDEERRQNEALWPWYHAYYHLAEAASQIKRMHAATSRLALAGSSHYDKFLRHWERLLRIIGE